MNGDQWLALQRRTLISLLLMGAMACGARLDQNIPQEMTSPLVIYRWPEEGVPILAWIGSEDSLAVYPHAGDESPTEHLAVAYGQLLEWDSSLILIHRPGKAEILEDCVISGHVYDVLKNGNLLGGKSRELQFGSGTIVDVICYAAEGFYIFRQQDRYLELDATDQRLEILDQPLTEWWIRITADGKPIGWTLVDGDNVSVVDRRF
jgi:hypothetical protein